MRATSDKVSTGCLGEKQSKIASARWVLVIPDLAATTKDLTNPDSLPQDGNPSSPADLAGDPCRRGRPPLPGCAGVLVRPHVFPAPKGFSCQTRWLHGAPRLRLSERARRA